MLGKILKIISILLYFFFVIKTESIIAASIVYSILIGPFWTAYFCISDSSPFLNPTFRKVFVGFSIFVLILFWIEFESLFISIGAFLIIFYPGWVTLLFDSPGVTYTSHPYTTQRTDNEQKKQGYNPTDGWAEWTFFEEMNKKNKRK